jgi:hypothetical protein
MLRLPFTTIEHPQFRKLLRLAQSAPSLPDFPSAKTIQRRLFSTVEARHQDILQSLPSGAKMSIALDCWTSPFRQSFMAITGYFIDVHWEYREILLGFQPLSGSHTGVNLGNVLFELLQKYKIEDRVLAVTTDNASNNGTLMDNIQESLQALGLPIHTPYAQIPCLAHVIQLSLKALLRKMEANPKNDTEEMEWTRENNDPREIVHTLNKVRYFLRSTSISLLC